MKPIIFLVLLTLTLNVLSQKELKIPSENVELAGTLLLPEKETKRVVLIISGSGSTDRNGNTLPNLINDGLKKLAEELTEVGYATLRYDKRGVGQSTSDAIKAEGLRFEQYALDANKWITYLKKQFEDITVIGHSQGALVGMLAVQKNPVNRFISLAGLSEDAYSTVKRQLSPQPQFVKDDAYPILDSLRIGVKVDSVPAYLNGLFHPNLQDYFISFMQYDPRKEIKKLKAPILVVQGTTDLQITVQGARELSNASPLSSLMIIDGMNHVLRKTTVEAQSNMATYSDPTIPLHEDLIPRIVSFLQSKESMPSQVHPGHD